MSVIRYRNSAEEAWQSIPTIRGEKGDAFTYDMFTTEQLEGLRGPQGIQGETGPQGIQGPAGNDYVITEADYAAIADVVLTKLNAAEDVSF